MLNFEYYLKCQELFSSYATQFDVYFFVQSNFNEFFVLNSEYFANIRTATNRNEFWAYDHKLLKASLAWPIDWGIDAEVECITPSKCKDFGLKDRTNNKQEVTVEWFSITLNQIYI